MSVIEFTTQDKQYTSNDTPMTCNNFNTMLCIIRPSYHFQAVLAENDISGCRGFNNDKVMSRMG